LIIPERAILMSTNRGDIVLDPFVGGGGTLKAAQDTGRYWLGSELGSTIYASRLILKDTKAEKRQTPPDRIRSVFK
jgi:DNA modification methylase